jgi:hypothetical protein
MALKSEINLQAKLYPVGTRAPLEGLKTGTKVKYNGRSFIVARFYESYVLLTDSETYENTVADLDQHSEVLEHPKPFRA